MKQAKRVLAVATHAVPRDSRWVHSRGSAGARMNQSVLAVAISLSIMLCGVHPKSVFASSYDDFGLTGSLSAPDYSAGSCDILTGPRQLSTGQSLAANEFLMTIRNGNGVELALQGTFQSDQGGKLDLSPDHALAETAFTNILQTQAGDPSIKFRLKQLSVSATILPIASNVEQADCRVDLTGVVTMNSEAAAANGSSGAIDDNFSVSNPITVNYKGLGTYLPGVSATESASAAFAGAGGNPACSLPDNLKPDSQSCSGANCLLDFAGFKWWTYNQFYPGGSGFWNNNNVWSPRNSSVDGAGLHLFVRPDNIGNGSAYMASEVVLLENADGSIADLGFGTYLVTAQVNSGSQTWDGLDPNVAFGAFTYEKEQTGTAQNPAREIDLAEISRWGHPAGQDCSDPVPVLCQGNAQFTLQKYTALPDYQNIRRYTISASANQITLVMVWSGANQPVTFKQYNGSFTLATLPSTPDNQWTTSGNQNPFIPDSNCQKFHLNFWMGNFPKAVNGINPPPSNPQEILITNFQFQPLS